MGIFMLLFVSYASLPVTKIECTEGQLRLSDAKAFSKDAPQRTSGSSETIPKMDTRLPRSLRPLHYLIQLQPFVNGNFSVFGYMEVEMEVLETTSNVTLHMLDIVTKNDTVKVLTLGGMAKREVGIKRHQYDHARQFYAAQMEEELMEGKKYILRMEFVGYLNDQLRGFYRSTYKDVNGKTKNLAVTQFQSTHARRAFPCFDEPAMKATFEVYLARETRMTSLSNMPLVETLPVEGQEGWVWDRFERSVPMSTYLVAFVVSDFSHISSATDEGPLFRVWTQPSAIQQAEYASKIGPRILAFYEEYFNVSYPLPKVDMVAVPDLEEAGMENWGLITFRETTLLFDPRSNSARYKERLVEVVAHELAHQWFGNLVTPKWWDDLWLNEGFATFESFTGSDHVEPSWRKREEFALEKLQKVFATDSLETSHRLCFPVGDGSAISEAFDGISYKKGASIIRMMKHFLGEAAFRRGLSSYLNAFMYSNADQDDLWQHLTVAAHHEAALPKRWTVKTIMDTWTLQRGYPVIKVARSSDGSSAYVSQERFLYMKNGYSSEDLRWWVPLSFTWQSEGDFNRTKTRRWITDSEEGIIIPSLPPKEEWVIFNLQETGYYRVNYDDHNWNLLIRQLRDDHEAIHVVNRAQIIDDAMNLARAGQLSYATALDAYAYLKQEKDTLPWLSGLANIAYLQLMFQSTYASGALKRYLLDLIRPVYATTGFDDSRDGRQSKKRMSYSVTSLACALGVRDCHDKSLRLFRQWMKNPEDNTIICPNLRAEVICLGISVGGEKEWNFIWGEYVKSSVARERVTLLQTLGCSRNTSILSRYLEMSLNPYGEIKKDDFKIVFNAVASSSRGRKIAWAFLKQHWNNIYSFKKRRRGTMLRKVSNTFNTRQDLRELEAFLNDSDTDLEEVTRIAKQTVEMTKSNVRWRDTNFAKIVQFLENNGYSTNGGQ
ncbi:aminopeptidase N-like [Penaeus japonicus]|uniref:aminopeptidase N-like n=1 Tax=Penaeus japonicus TaxID=27405 RepID=UPI001C70CAFD|nr:aminopeptidase N-like [Penaeus japonicus]